MILGLHWAIWLFLYGLFQVPFLLGWAGLSGIDTYKNTIFIFPKNIYESYEVNWFGTILIYLIYLITQLYVAIIGFIYWLCKVGRN